jgi:hypothetical protein
MPDRSEPTWEQEAEYWHDAHERLVLALKAVAWESKDHDELFKRAVALYYSHSGGMAPSPMQRERLHKLLFGLDTEPTEQ